MTARERLLSIRSQIDRAAGDVGRDPSKVTLVAVSKGQTLDAVRELYDLGVRDFGESRLQEATPKIEALPNDVTWHFIGHLQSNKARRVASLFSVIHTLDSESQLREIGKAEQGVDGLIEVNLAEEAQKSGVLPAMLDVFYQETIKSPSVRFRGLMTIGPADLNPEETRKLFRNLREINGKYGGEWLSMGMSNDFGLAVQEGATHVRVGTALFGAR